MRIAMVSEHANPLAPPGGVDSGGQNVHVAALSCALAERGHRVTVFTRRDDPSTPNRVPLHPGVDVVHIAAGPPRRIPKDDLLPHMDALARGMAAAWLAAPPEAVHCHFWMSGLAGIAAARAVSRYRTPPALVQTFHALGSVKRRYQGDDDTSPPQRIDFEALIGNRVDAVIATCPDEREELLALGVPDRRIAIVPCGVDQRLFTPVGEREPRDSAFRLLSAGRLVPRKGVDAVISALAVLAERGGPAVELDVIGGDSDSGSEIGRLDRLARDLGVAHRVRFRGGIARERMPEMLRSADAVVCTPWYEPFGIVPLEAMACGVPVIASAVGGLQDSVVDGVTGILVPPRSPDAIAAAVQRLIAKPWLGRALGAAGRFRVETEYSWASVADRTERVYARLLTDADLPRRAVETQEMTA